MADGTGALQMRIILDERYHLDSRIFLSFNFYRVAQWPAEPVEVDLHHVAILKLDPLSEA